jgi:CRP-like cAMP-binding protein
MFDKTKEINNSIISSLKESVLFRNMDKSDVIEVLKIAHIREYSDQERIFSEGTLGICFYYIIKGEVDVVSEDGLNTKVLHTHCEQAFFSEVHLFSESVHSVSCLSKGLTTLFVLSKPDFEELIRLKPRTGSKFLLNFLEFFSSQLDKLYKENRILSDKITAI